MPAVAAERNSGKPHDASPVKNPSRLSLGFARLANRIMPGSALPRSAMAGSFLACFKPCEIDPMPKQKTHKGCKKRFRITGRGKLKHRRSGTSHLNSRMSKKRRRNLRGTSVLAAWMPSGSLIVLAGNSY